jgi:hypothetical protein
MQITDEERFALSKLYDRPNDFDAAITANVDKVSVIERTMTGVGYFTTIQFQCDLPDSTESERRSWNFKHKKLHYGGLFTAYYEKPNVIELEAVVHDGKWPDCFNAEDFSEM